MCVGVNPSASVSLGMVRGDDDDVGRRELRGVFGLEPDGERAFSHGTENMRQKRNVVCEHLTLLIHIWDVLH